MKQTMFFDRKKLGRIQEESSVPTLTSVRRKIASSKKAAFDDFRPSNAPPDNANVRYSNSNSIAASMLLDSYGSGGFTKGVEIFDDLVSTKRGQFFLLCVPEYTIDRKKNPLYELWRQYCGKSDAMVSIVVPTCEKITGSS